MRILIIFVLLSFVNGCTWWKKLNTDPCEDINTPLSECLAKISPRRVTPETMLVYNCARGKIYVKAKDDNGLGCKCIDERIAYASQCK